MNIESNLINRKIKCNTNIDFYIKYLNDLKNNKKSSGKGLNISDLLILLPKIYTNTSSKELISNIKQLINNLYDSKQITKQLYNILNKAITYKNDS